MKSKMISSPLVDRPLVLATFAEVSIRIRRRILVGTVIGQLKQMFPGTFLIEKSGYNRTVWRMNSIKLEPHLLALIKQV